VQHLNIIVSATLCSTSCRTGSGLKTSARAELGLYTLGSGVSGPWSLFSKIGLGLRLLLNTQKSQARGPSPKPRYNRARAFGLFSKSPSLNFELRPKPDPGLSTCCFHIPTSQIQALLRTRTRSNHEE
jgi:hypothetical protein